MIEAETHLFKYLSASFYYKGINEFGFFWNYRSVCDEDD